MKYFKVRCRFERGLFGFYPEQMHHFFHKDLHLHWYVMHLPYLMISSPSSTQKAALFIVVVGDIRRAQNSYKSTSALGCSEARRVTAALLRFAHLLVLALLAAAAMSHRTLRS